jgi:hypothetical protein
MAAQRDNFPITSFGLPTRSPPVKSQVVGHTALDNHFTRNHQIYPFWPLIKWEILFRV